jgi:SAM-dependent methyltransferase
MFSSKSRFTDRVSLYQQYRPSYPVAAFDFIAEASQLDANSKVADIGSGTGISAKILLEKGFEVFAVEPNDSMRMAAEDDLRLYPKFHSIAASAENTSLDSESIDIVVAAQAFHWFDKSQFKKECFRIGKSSFSIALIWNDRDISQPFQKAYESFLQEFSIDYNAVNHLNISDETLEAFLAPSEMKKASFPYAQKFDLEGLIGRAASSSYLPGPGHERYGAMKNALITIFQAFEQDGFVIFAYITRVYFSKFSKII